MAKVTVAAALALLALSGAPGCGEGDVYENTLLVQGDPGSGRRIIAQKDCGACHTIPGIRGANSLVGPPLNGFGRRSFVAGTLPNSAENLARWIQDPPSIRPGTAMPDLGVSEAESRDIAAYLHSLR